MEEKSLSETKKVVKLEEEEVQQDETTAKDAEDEDRPVEGGLNDTMERNDRKVFQRQSNGVGFGRDGNFKSAEEG